MGGRTSRRAQETLAVAIVAALALAVVASQALATGTLIVAANANAYQTPNNSLRSQGLQADFSNTDTVTHTVTADENGPDGKPLFRTGNTPGGTMRPVAGTTFLTVGSYDFHCSIHPVMQGTLEVPNSGVPQDRPEIEVAVKSKKLAKVVRSGKLKVKVSAAQPTDAGGVSLSAKKGRKKITKSAKLNLGAGNTKTAKLKLKKSAAEKLAALDKAKVRVTGEVDFGSPAKDSRKLK